MANYEIKITQRAFSDITECVLFVNNVSNIAAKELYSEIVSSIKSLKEFPNKYPEITGLTIRNVKIRKMPIHNGRYMALYKVEQETITICDVLDTRKDNYILKL